MTSNATEHKKRRQYSDQYHCHHCGKQWDVNDPNPPECVDKSCRDCDGSGEFYQIEGIPCHCRPDNWQPEPYKTKRVKSEYTGGYHCGICNEWYTNLNPCDHH